MADVKWIQIVTDIFDNWKVKQIKAMPEGHTMVCIWFEMLCLAGKQNDNGYISFSGKLVTTEDLLATLLNEDVSVIKMALKVFEQLNMITVVDNDDIQISNWCEYQNTEGLNKIRENGRERQKRFREKQKALKIEEDSNVTRNVTNTLPVTHVSYSYSNSNSYSFSNNSNISNLEYVLNSDYMYAEYIKTNNELYECIKGWLDYKDNKKPKGKHHYSSERSLGTLLSQFVKNEKEYGIDALINAVNESIAGEYQGIVWDKCKNAKPKKMTMQSGGRDLLAELMNC